jgi:hypothetical protein
LSFDTSLVKVPLEWLSYIDGATGAMEELGSGLIMSVGGVVGWACFDLHTCL